MVPTLSDKVEQGSALVPVLPANWRPGGAAYFDFIALEP